MATTDRPTTGTLGSAGSGSGSTAAGVHAPDGEPGNTGGRSGLGETLRNQVSSRISSQKDRAAEGLGSVVEAVRQTGQQLRGKNDALAGYVDSAATHLERWSSQLRDRDVSDVVDDVKMFARRRPALFLGGGLALGAIAARILKSSGDRQADTRSAQRFTSAGSRRVPMDTRGSLSRGLSTTGGALPVDVAADRRAARPAPTPGMPRSGSRG